MSVITTSNIINKPFNSLKWLEKADTGKVTLEDIGDALEEFARLFKAGIASKAETLTLSRAFPSNRHYTEAAANVGDDDPMVVGGPASVSLIDREGHLITTDALKKAFDKFMGNFRTRNAMVLHSDVQIGWALPAYITRGGQIFKSGVDDKGLFFICELRDDTKISEKVRKEIDEGRLRSYSIAGSALKVQNMQKGMVPYMQVDEMELAEVTVCEKGVNQNATFDLLKAEVPQTGKIDKDQCGYRDATPEETAKGINCGHCKYFNEEDKSCDVVTGDILPGDYCKIFAPMAQKPTKVVVVMRNKENVDFKKSFDMWLAKAEAAKDPFKSKESLAVLENFAGREAEHHQLLREYGFPSEQPSESQRYNPVVETETNDKGVPIHIKPPWVVNEAGQDLGDKLDEDSPEYHKSDKAKNRKKAKSIQKMRFLFKAPGDESLAGKEPLIERRRTSKETADRYKSGATGPNIGKWNTQAEKTLADEKKRKEQESLGQQRQEGDEYTPREEPPAPKRPGLASRLARRLSTRRETGRIKRAGEKARKETIKSSVAPSGWGNAPIPADPSTPKPERPGLKERLGRQFGIRRRAGRIKSAQERQQTERDRPEREADEKDAAAAKLRADRKAIRLKPEREADEKDAAAAKLREDRKAIRLKGTQKTERLAQKETKRIARIEQKKAKTEGSIIERLRRQSAPDKKPQFATKVPTRYEGAGPSRNVADSRGIFGIGGKKRGEKTPEGESDRPDFHIAGGLPGSNMSYEQHDEEFQNYHSHIAANGHATVREHLDALDRMGHTPMRDRLFTVHPGALSQEDMGKKIHATEFADMIRSGKVGVKTAGPYKDHHDSVANMGKGMVEGGSVLHQYANHLAATPKSASAPSAAQSSGPVKAGRMGSLQVAPPASPSVAPPTPGAPSSSGGGEPKKTFQVNPQTPAPPEDDRHKQMLFSKKAVIDKMLMKATWGGKYA